MKILSFFICILFPFVILANPINWPYLPSNDYFRGTAGERLFFQFVERKKGHTYINNDFRHYRFTHYWDRSGEKFNSSAYSRSINIFSFHYIPTNRIQVSIRIPLVKAEYKFLSNLGLSDVLMGFSYEIATLMNNQLKLSLSTGLKIPVGYYEYEHDKIPLGTGSFDIPFVINTNFLLYHAVGYFDVGYILIGKSKLLYPEFNQDKVKNNGDEIFSDFAIIKELSSYLAIKFEANYYYVFNSIIENKEKDDDGQSKFSIIPGVIFSLYPDELELEFSFSYDVFGNNTFSGYTPVFRIHYNSL